MGVIIRMPQLGESDQTAKIIHSRIRKGQQVREGDTLAEIETEKATLDLTIPSNGTVLEIYFKVGDKIPVGELLCIVGEPSERIEQILHNETPEYADEPLDDLPPTSISDLSIQINGKTIAVEEVIEAYLKIADTLDKDPSRPSDLINAIKRLKKKSKSKKPWWK